MIVAKKLISLIFKSLMIPLMCSALILGLVVYSESSVYSALNGINLWLNIVFPSLFPFFVASELLNKTGFVRALGALLEPVMLPLFNVPGCASFALAMGVTSGYPVGAKITADLYSEGLLTKSEAERLIAFTNNSGPLFIFGAVAAGMFKMPELGLLLFACHFASSITVGLLFRFYKRKSTAMSVKRKYSAAKRFKHELVNGAKVNNWGSAFGEAVKNSIMTILAIGGFIIFFSVLVNLLNKVGVISAISSFVFTLLKPFGINEEIIAAVVSGVFEITTGCNLASKVQSAPFIHRLCSAGLIIGFAGFSVHSQVMGIAGKTGISLKSYILGKSIQSIVACIYTYIAAVACGLNHVTTAAPVEGMNGIYTMIPPFWALYTLIASLLVIVLGWKKIS